MGTNKKLLHHRSKKNLVQQPVLKTANGNILIIEYHIRRGYDIFQRILDLH